MAERRAERNERELDAAVRRVAEQARARRPGHDPSIRITRVEPSSLAPTPIQSGECANCGLAFLPGDGRRRDAGRRGLLVHTDGGCERARRRASARAGDTAPEPEEVPVNASAAPASETEPRLVDAWRDQAVVEWLLAEGAKTASEIASQFAIKQPQNLIVRLRTRGLIEKTGVKRLARGATSGRPGAEYRAVAREPEPPTGPERPAAVAAPISEPAGKLDPDSRAARNPAAPASGTERQPDHAADRTDDDTTPASALTVHEQLVVRYITALINSIDRASILRDAAAPEHVYDRIERLLRIADGAA